jgi:hypothetical protein
MSGTFTERFNKLNEHEQYVLMCEMHSDAGPDEDIDICDCKRCVSIREAN